MEDSTLSLGPVEIEVLLRQSGGEVLSVRLTDIWIWNLSVLGLSKIWKSCIGDNGSRSHAPG